MKTCILGAGMTGLAAGYNKNIPIYEASDHAGGICTTYTKDGFEFDIGGSHWIFGNNEAVDFIKTLVPLNTYDRRAGVYMNKIFPYPIQNYLNQPNESTEGFFKDWNSKKFSNEMCNLFFHPFNEKYTAGYYNDIVQFDAYKTPTDGTTGYCPQFHNPVGGLATLVDALKKRCDIHYNKKVVQVKFQDRKVKFSDGEEVRYDQIISTLPLNRMLSLCGRQDFNLPYSSVLVLNIGAEPGSTLPKEHWLYVPFCRTNFYRVGFYSNVEPLKAPAGMASLCVEMAFRGVDYEELDIPYIIQEVVRELQDWNWIGKVITCDPTWIPTAYTWNRVPEEREKHIAWLAECRIKSIGRYGLWKFQGICESIQQGLKS